MIREILPSMLERNRGHIVAMSSMSSLEGIPAISTYSVTKWGTNGKCIYKSRINCHKSYYGVI